MDPYAEPGPDDLSGSARPRRRVPASERIEQGKLFVPGARGEICLGEAVREIWTLCDGRLSIDEICDRFASRRGRTGDSVAAEVEKILRRLSTEGLLDPFADRERALRRLRASSEPLQELGCREDFADLLHDLDLLGWGVELGARHGAFSRYLLETTDLRLLFSVDAWADRGYGGDDYRQAVDNLAHLGTRSVVLRMTFEDAAKLFADDSLDVLYLDGFADDRAVRETLEAWRPKLRVGGLISGHDYSPAWPEVVRGVDAFAAEYGEKVFATREVRRGPKCGPYPSWMILKSGRG